MNPGDIVLIRFLQTDLTSGKLRPTLVLADVPGRFDDVLLVMISSQARQRVEGFDDVIGELDTDFEESGLKTSSVIRVGRLATIDKQLIEGRLGRISDERLQTVRKRLVEWLTGEVSSSASE